MSGVEGTGKPARNRTYFEWLPMFYVYILASRRNGTIYVGSCEDLVVRVEQHKTKHFGGFTARYKVDQLVWFESHPSREQAFVRERRIKEWKRLWKQQLIEARNPNWIDLFADLSLLLPEEDERSWGKVLPGSRRSPG
jgi:putative endonuclease